MMRRIERRFAKIANRRRLALGIVFLAALLSSAIPYLLYSRSVSPFSSWSFFTTYDELSYLLAADTYSSGRLTNPTHEMWRHFQTYAVIHEPSYQSMYPPAQGMFLALGQVLSGHPIVGVWIGMALACCAICYMLQAWFPPRWALLGGLLAAFHGRMALEWGGTYFGGGVAMLGGALTFGGLRHLVNRPRLGDSILLALGLALLANSRPFEGLVASAPAFVVLAAWLLAYRPLPLGTRITRVVAPITAVLVTTAAGIAYYNYRVTENPWTLPYQVHLAANVRETPFIWQKHQAGPGVGTTNPVENGEAVESSETEEDDLLARENHEAEPASTNDTEWWFSGAYLYLLSHSSLIVSLVFKVVVQWAFYFGPVLSVPLVALLWGVGNRWTWFAIVTSSLTLLAVLMTTGAWPHYLSPVAPLVFVLAIQGSRNVRTWRHRGRRIGRRWVPTLAVLWFLSLILLVTIFPRLMKDLRWADSRNVVQAQLERLDGNHLVMVRYGAGHTWYKEWVYNEADIDRAKVVWARELAPESNRRLLDYFEGRHIWLLEPDRSVPGLVPYDTDFRSHK